MKSKENKIINLKKGRLYEKPLSDEFCQIPDAALWKLFKDGHKKAFDVMYDRLFQPLCWYGDKICAHQELVEDVIQDLFIDLWIRRAHLGGTDSIKFYLFRCLRRKLLRRMGQEAKRNAYFSSQALDFHLDLSDKSAATATSEEEERKTTLALALNKLTDRQREAIYLKFYNNLSFQEVASVMDIEVRSVYNLIGRTIDILRADFKKKNEATTTIPLTFIFSILGAYLGSF